MSEKDDPIRVSFMFFEENFAGVRPFELQLTVIDEDKALLDKAVIAEMVEVESYIKETYGVGFVGSPLNIIRSANQALHGGHDTAYAIPGSDKELASAIRPYKQAFKATRVCSFNDVRFEKCSIHRQRFMTLEGKRQKR